MPRRAPSRSSSARPSLPSGGRAGSRAAMNTSRARSGNTPRRWATPRRAPSPIPAPRWRRMSTRICESGSPLRADSSPASDASSKFLPRLRGRAGWGLSPHAEAPQVPPPQSYLASGGGGRGDILPSRERVSTAIEAASSRTLRRPEELVATGLVRAERLLEIAAVAREFALAVTPAMAGLIDPADPADPIAAQFIPSAAELATAPEE